MMRVHASGRTDVGRVREVNEDAFHVGDSVFAVADGMGGHLAGEVASSTALEPIADLDGHVYADAQDARNALRQAVTDANEAVVTKAANDPSFQGMGTTLTAVMVEGRRAHVAHVGDSRAYLFRDGEFSQLTTDHTLVQRMIEEGRLTEEEAANHPQRSVITRAIGVEPNVDVDAMTLELAPGDVLVLCSDGLTGPVTDSTIIGALDAGTSDVPDEAGTDGRQVDRVAQKLVDAANAAGAPDNVTVVVLEFSELPTAPSPQREPAAPPPVVVSTAPDTTEGDWASRLGRLGDLGGQRGVPTGGEATEERSHRGVSTGQRVTAVVITIGLLLGAAFAGGRWILSRSWYVGLDDETVVIYQGVPATVGPFELSWEHQQTDLTTEDLPTRIVVSLEDGVSATSAAEAERLVDNYRRMADGDDTE